MGHRPFPPLTEEGRTVRLVIVAWLLSYLLVVGWLVRLVFWTLGWPWGWW
jgi:hypothetical protein